MHAPAAREDPDAPAVTAEDPAPRDDLPEDPDAPVVTTDASGHQVPLVRRRRVPALGFWVLVAIAVAVIGGVVTAWVTGVRDVAGMLYFAATAVMVVGIPLAGISAIVDGVPHRRRRAPRR